MDKFLDMTFSGNEGDEVAIHLILLQALQLSEWVLGMF
jgi:hypothetical protein